MEQIAHGSLADEPALLPIVVVTVVYGVFIIVVIDVVVVVADRVFDVMVDITVHGVGNVVSPTERRP